MIDTLITFETAKLVKEKGFDWPVSHIIAFNEVNNSHEYTGETEFTLEEAEAATSNTEKEHYLCPSQSLLQKWLRETHKLDIVIQAYADENGDQESPRYDYEMYYPKFTEEDYGGTPKYHVLYEECLEEALIDGLNSLKL
jgi:hypothetical protein